jgi:hypothetical protein
MKWVTPVALGIVVALAAPAQAVRQVDARTMTIRLISTDTGSTVLTERPPTGQASKGDLIVVSAKLRNAERQLGRPKGAVVGNASYVFTFRSQTVADVIVESTLFGGRLRAAGLARLNTGRHTFTVTGGRGTFANAHGTAGFRPLPCHCERQLLLYRLRLP